MLIGPVLHALVGPGADELLGYASPRRVDDSSAAAGSRSALRVAHLGHIRAGLAEVDVVLRALVGQRELVELSQLAGDRLHASGSVEPGSERLARLTLA